MTWSNAFKVIRPYITKIESPAGSGTGFFFAYNESQDLVAVATALHVIQEANEWRQPIKIKHVESNKELFLPHNERAVLVDYRRDSAAILLPTKALSDAGLPVPSKMLEMMPSDKYKPIGVHLAWTGYPAIAPRTLCLFQGGVSAFNKDDDSYFIDGIAINGVSGGPVFFEKNGTPQIVGIVSAYQYNRQSDGALPGLLTAHDATHLNTIVENLKNMAEARKKAAEAAEAAASQVQKVVPDAAGPAEPQPSRESEPAATPSEGLPSRKRRRRKLATKSGP